MARLIALASIRHRNATMEFMYTHRGDQQMLKCPVCKTMLSIPHSDTEDRRFTCGGDEIAVYPAIQGGLRAPASYWICGSRLEVKVGAEAADQERSAAAGQE